MSEWEIVEENKGNAVIKVIGVGGGGGFTGQRLPGGGGHSARAGSAGAQPREPI